MTSTLQKKFTAPEGLRNVLSLTAACVALAPLPFQAASAHPVVFANGTAIMGHHDGEVAALEIIHSPRWWYGVGIEGERTNNSSSLLARVNALVWRGNFPDLQSNLYLGVAAGVGWGPHGETFGAQDLEREQDQNETSNDRSHRSRMQAWSIEADAEDRQYYGKVRFKQMLKNERPLSHQMVTRLGLAPYKAQADEPSLWTILEWTVDSDAKLERDEHKITPLVRYFYRNMLFEVGSSLNGHLKFNYMVHYF